jgi:DNA adenine methylase
VPDAAGPFLRWAGSKRRLLPKLLPYWREDAKRYFEPFVGSAALFFALRPKVALLSDINPELMATYRTVRSRSQQVAAALQVSPRTKASYLRLRRTKPDGLSSVARAVRFVFLNRYCFNGLYRTNAAGTFNVPYAPTATGSLPTSGQLSRVAATLRRAELLCGDFEALLTAEVEKGDFVYLDPPFAVANRRVFRQYGPQVFGTRDLERLAGLLDLLDRRGATFVVSYAYCREALTYFDGWTHRRVLTQRNIAGFVGSRREAAELIISNVTPAA